MSIDWADPKCKITDHFTVGDACMLHQWNRLANESDGLNGDIKDILIKLCQKMEQVRTILNCQMTVHCMFRSVDYNKLIGALPNDVHSKGMACDFDSNDDFTIQEVKDRLVNELESLGIRMERGTTSWIHLDIHEVIHQRYFNP